MAIDYNRRPSTPAPAQEPAVNLSKISLTKAAPTVSLTKAGQQGAMRVNLNWSQGAGQAKTGFLSKLAGPSGGGGVDLDLGCLYELSNGDKGVVQALGNAFGSLTGAPHIKLDADDRTGSAAGGENMHIDLSRPELFRRILIFAMIYEGAPNWAAVDGVVTLFPTSGPQVEVKLDSASNSARICAIALLQNTGSGIDVTREVRYIDGSQSTLDRTYGWGMKWTAGSK
ncbi:TerD family protein [Mycobacteroides abscessus]|uniref:TerD family protein n=1 Tax=Mycobacteroides abscessus TaxID=36809 RepID=UPI000944E012|nr:tellerium resistance protein [Mycobacteroides abscessus]